jgi:protein arginine kinase
LCEQERAAREILLSKFGVVTRDLIGRALGTLRYAHILSCREATQALSMLRLGHEIGLMRGLSRQKWNELLVQIRPAVLQVEHGGSLSGIERDTLRATLLRAAMARVKLESDFEIEPN